MVQVETEGAEEAFDEINDVRFSDTLTEEISAACEAAASIILQNLIAFTPEKTGLTAASWQVVVLDRDDYMITNTNEPIITYLSEGTAAHWVEPVSAQALHWIDEDTGADMFSKGHMVSGIVPRHIEEDALAVSESELEQLFDAAVESAMRSYGE